MNSKTAKLKFFCSQKIVVGAELNWEMAPHIPEILIDQASKNTATQNFISYQR